MIQAENMPGHGNVDDANDVGARPAAGKPFPVALQCGNVLGQPFMGVTGLRGIRRHADVAGVLEGLIVDLAGGYSSFGGAHDQPSNLAQAA